MKVGDYAITFACYNQVAYTRQLIDSLLDSGVDLARVIVVDNASTDDTRRYLETLPLGGRIFNRSNLGCGVAWNQGALALQAEWTVVMNNDILVAPGWLENLIGAAREHELKIVSPSMIEGVLDYDFNEFAAAATVKMKSVLREGGRHAVCVGVHASVWADVGYFRAVPTLWGYEDTLFFHEAERAGIAMGMTGSSWLHHFGSLTVKALKEERGLAPERGLSARRSYRLLQVPFFQRKLRKLRDKRQREHWRDRELAAFGMTMYGVRTNGHFKWL
ncbi:MAG: glycosyltransferase [Pseudomonadota bacterium]